jgi:hypothetical protein
VAAVDLEAVEQVVVDLGVVLPSKKNTLKTLVDKSNYVNSTRSNNVSQN